MCVMIKRGVAVIPDDSVRGVFRTKGLSASRSPGFAHHPPTEPFFTAVLIAEDFAAQPSVCNGDVRIER